MGVHMAAGVQELPRQDACEACGGPVEASTGADIALTAEAVRYYTEDMLGFPMEPLCNACWLEFFTWAETEGRVPHEEAAMKFDWPDGDSGRLLHELHCREDRCVHGCGCPCHAGIYMGRRRRRWRKWCRLPGLRKGRIA